MVKRIKDSSCIRVYHKGRGFWLHYPDGTDRIGYITIEKLCLFFKALSEGKTISEADKVFEDRAPAEQT